MSRNADAVLAAVHELDHPTADEVYERLRSTGSRLSRATVYRHLAHLAEAGRVRVRDIGSSNRYDPHLDAHVHLHDARTGRLVDVPMTDALRDALADLAAEHLVAQDDCIVELRGTLKE